MTPRRETWSPRQHDQEAHQLIEITPKPSGRDENAPAEADNARPQLPLSRPPKIKGSAYCEALSRSLGLSLFYAKATKCQEEYPKVALWKDRRVAIPRLLLHFIPVTASIVLLWFNLHGYYIGEEMAGLTGHDVAKENALQFAAKLHEVSITASISIIVFSLVQRRLVSSGTSFGAVLSGVQFTQLSYFWSKELSEALKAEWTRENGKIFIFTLLVAMCLAPVVGPSSALR